jgi:hypothetical protein
MLRASRPKGASRSRGKKSLLLFFYTSARPPKKPWYEWMAIYGTIYSYLDPTFPLFDAKLYASHWLGYLHDNRNSEGTQVCPISVCICVSIKVQKFRSVSNTVHAYSSHIPQFAVLIAKMLHSLLLQWKAIQFSTVRLNHFFFCINVKLTRGLWIKQGFKTKITQDKSSNRATLVAETTVEWVDGLPNNWSIMGPDCLRGEPISHGRWLSWDRSRGHPDWARFSKRPVSANFVRIRRSFGIEKWKNSQTPPCGWWTTQLQRSIPYSRARFDGNNLGRNERWQIAAQTQKNESPNFDIDRTQCFRAVQIGMFYPKTRSG